MTANIDSTHASREPISGAAAPQEPWEAEALEQVGKLSAMFEAATGWGSWMVMAANERERLVDRLNATGRHKIEHKWQARTTAGGRVS